jgi:hypothetical protein
LVFLVVLVVRGRVVEGTAGGCVQRGGAGVLTVGVGTTLATGRAVVSSVDAGGRPSERGWVVVVLLPGAAVLLGNVVGGAGARGGVDGVLLEGTVRGGAVVGAPRPEGGVAGEPVLGGPVVEGTVTGAVVVVGAGAATAVVAGAVVARVVVDGALGGGAVVTEPVTTERVAGAGGLTPVLTVVGDGFDVVVTAGWVVDTGAGLVVVVVEFFVGTFGAVVVVVSAPSLSSASFRAASTRAV